MSITKCIVHICTETEPIEFEHSILFVFLFWPSNRKTGTERVPRPLCFKKSGLFQAFRPSAISDLRLVNEFNARDRADIALK